MQHALAKDLSARLGVNASRVQLRSVHPAALPSTRHLLAVSLSDAFWLCHLGMNHGSAIHSREGHLLPLPSPRLQLTASPISCWRPSHIVMSCRADWFLHHGICCMGRHSLLL